MSRQTLTRILVAGIPMILGLGLMMFQLWGYQDSPIGGMLRYIVGGGGQHITFDMLLINTQGAFLAGWYLAYLYRRTHVREDFSLHQTFAFREVATTMAFMYMILQRNAILGVALCACFAIIGWILTNRSHTDASTTLMAILIGFLASTRITLEDWSFVLLFLASVSLWKHWNYWKTMNSKFDEDNLQYDCLLMLTYIGTNPDKDVELLEKILQKHVNSKRRSDFVAPRDDNKVQERYLGSIEFDLEDPTGSRSPDGGPGGLMKDLLENLSDKFLFENRSMLPTRHDRIYVKRKSRFRRLVSSAVVMLALAFGGAASAAEPAPSLEIQKKAWLIEKMVDALREGHFPARTFNALLGPEQPLGLADAERRVRVHSRKDQSAVLLAALDKFLKSSPRGVAPVQSSRPLNVQRIIPVTAKDVFYIERRLKMFTREHLTLVVDDDAAQAFEDVRKKFPQRVRIRNISEPEIHLYSSFSNGRALNLYALENVLQSIPKSERS